MALSRFGMKQNVPRRTIFVEWGGFGAACWKWFVLLGLHLRSFTGICVLQQRTAIFGNLL
jgi:hypothetical protein